MAATPAAQPCPTSSCCHTGCPVSARPQCPGHRPAHPWLSCLGTTVSATHLPDTPHPPGSPWPARIPLTFPAPVLGPVWPRAYEAPGRGRQIKIDAQSAGAGGAPSQGPVTKASGRASVGHTVVLISATQQLLRVTERSLGEPRFTLPISTGGNAALHTRSPPGLLGRWVLQEESHPSPWYQAEHARVHV